MNNSRRTLWALASAVLLLAGVVSAIALTTHRASPSDELELKQNFPNPFSVSTEIRYVTPVTGHVLLRIFNTIGKEVQVLVNETKPANQYVARFDGSSYPSGQYTYVLEFASSEDGAKSKLTKRMYLVR